MLTEEVSEIKYRFKVSDSSHYGNPSVLSEPYSNDVGKRLSGA